MDFQRWDLLTHNPTCLDLFHWDNMGIWETFYAYPPSNYCNSSHQKIWKTNLSFWALCLFSGAILVFGSVVAVPLIGMHCYIVTLTVYHMISHDGSTDTLAQDFCRPIIGEALACCIPFGPFEQTVKWWRNPSQWPRSGTRRISSVSVPSDILNLRLLFPFNLAFTAFTSYVPSRSWLLRISGGVPCTLSSPKASQQSLRQSLGWRQASHPKTPNKSMTHGKIWLNKKAVKRHGRTLTKSSSILASLRKPRLATATGSVYASVWSYRVMMKKRSRTVWRIARGGGSRRHRALHRQHRQHLKPCKRKNSQFARWYSHGHLKRIQEKTLITALRFVSLRVLRFSSVRRDTVVVPVLGPTLTLRTHGMIHMIPL